MRNYFLVLRLGFSAFSTMYPYCKSLAPRRPEALLRSTSPRIGCTKAVSFQPGAMSYLAASSGDSLGIGRKYPVVEERLVRRVAGHGDDVVLSVTA